MKQCPQCSQLNQDESNACFNCGFLFNQYQPQQVQPQEYANQDNSYYQNQAQPQYQQSNNYQPYGQEAYNQPQYNQQQYPQPSYNQQQPAMAGGYQAQQYSPLAKPANSKTKFIVIGAIAGVAVIAVILILVFVVFKGDKKYSSYEDAIANYIQAEQDADVDKMLSLLPPGIADKMNELYQAMYGSSMSEYLKSEADEDRQNYIEKYGDDFSIEYKIISTEEMSESALSSLQSSYSVYGVTDITINSGLEVEIEKTYKGSKKTRTTTDIINVIQIDGYWYISD